MVGIIQLKDRSLKGRSVVWCKPPELRDVEDVDRRQLDDPADGFELSKLSDGRRTSTTNRGRARWQYL